MPKRTLTDKSYCLRKQEVTLHSRVVLGAAGAISSQTAQRQSGMVISKVGATAGRYLVTLDDAYPELLDVNAFVIGDTTAAYPTANGREYLIRNVTIGTSNGRTFHIQFVRTDTGADAEIENNRSFNLTVVVNKSRF